MSSVHLATNWLGPLPHRGSWRRVYRRLTAVLLVFLALLVAPDQAQASPASAGPGNRDPLQYPDSMPSVQVSLPVDDLDASGRWTQTVRLTIQSGGTLGDASEIVFGDLDHVDAIFAAAKKNNPRLVSPAAIPIGQQIDVAIDPSTTFALQAVLNSTDARVLRFTNGVVDTTFPTPRGSVWRVLAFPVGKATKSFAYPGATGPIKVSPGGKIVDLVYLPGESYADIVGQAFGVTNYVTAAELTKQTGWDPTRWPPQAGDARRIVVDAPDRYQMAPTGGALIPNPDPVGQARQLALRKARSSVGITIARLESFGRVYHVAVSDPTATASGIASLIYGSNARRLDVARAAGFQPPNANPATAASFDPHLFGREFDVSVDYVDERFLIWRRETSTGQVEVELADGARITSYPAASAGPILQVSYPTGYRRIVYRPGKTLLTVAQGLALFHVAGDLTLPAGTAAAFTREYEAQVVWQWGSGIPRRPTDIPDSVQLIDDPAGTYLVALVSPPGPRTLVDGATDTLRLSNPVLVIVGLVFVGSILALAIDLARRSVGRRRRVRW